MSPYTIFALGFALGILGGVILASLLTTASRTDHEADEMYEEELKRRRVAEAEARDHRERHQSIPWERIGVR